MLKSPDQLMEGDKNRSCNIIGHPSSEDLCTAFKDKSYLLLALP